MNIREVFGANTFSRKVMKERLPIKIYEKLIKTIEAGETIDISIADTVAQSVKDWAIEKGATHYTHWFQPLSRGTAEKHDSFLDRNSLENGEAILKFTKDELIQAEPDASSFPSGGMRSTFEARGYTVWDPTSPILIIGTTLIIPSIFTSYIGEALDKKTPLLRSIKSLNKETLKILELLKIESSGVYPTVGPEQEYFLTYKELADQRPDLILTGRTLIGRESPRGQKLEDHYFGTIRADILDFMNDLEEEAFKIGIPVTTRHNEVAPTQFEMAPHFEHANIANDKNKLLMEMMPRVARKHGFEVFLHEKPFQGVNGSGKHNNFSIQTYEGRNLFEIGKSIDQQLEFLLFVTIMLKAVHERGELLRAAVAPAGNDFRLGANEAPPGIISVYLGTTITDILDKIASEEFDQTVTEDEFVTLGIEQLPMVRRDNSDRNRTSPFAFTGNKFEFRAVGSSQSLGFPNTFLNAIMAESMDKVAKILKKNLNGDRNAAILATIKDVYTKAKPIVFNGNNYSDDWVEEAKARKLPNISSAYEALQVLTKKSMISMLDKYNILTPRELNARYSIDMDHLSSQIEIEANTLVYMVDQGVVPAVLRYLKETGMLGEVKIRSVEEIRDEIVDLFDNMRLHTNELKGLLSKISEMDDVEASKFCTYEIRPKMAEIRHYSDELEGFIPEDTWPYPSYIELLHSQY